MSNSYETFTEEIICLAEGKSKFEIQTSNKTLEGTDVQFMLGLTLVVAAFAAIGLYMSSLTEQPVVAAITSFGLLLLLWILDWAGSGQAETSGLMSWLSMLRHYEPLLKGLFNSTDIAYYLLVIILFIGLSIRRMDATRLQH